MKRITLWVSVAFLTFALGVACVLLWVVNRNSAELQGNVAPTAAPVAIRPEPLDVPLCRLLDSPEEYEGKIVRVKVYYVFGKHGATLSDRNCSVTDNHVWISIRPAMWDEIKQAMTRAYGRGVSGPLDITAVGRFKKNNPSNSSASLADTAPYRFDLMRIEKAVRPR